MRDSAIQGLSRPLPRPADSVYTCIYIIMAEKLPIALTAIAEVCLALRVRRLARRVSRYYDRALAPFGLDCSQFNILTVIGATGPVALMELARVLDLAPSTLSRALKTLKVKGLIVTVGGRGRGGLTLELTEAAEELMALSLTAWKSAQQGLVLAVGSADIGRILESFDRLDHAAL